MRYPLAKTVAVAFTEPTLVLTLIEPLDTLAEPVIEPEPP